jgi:hypothetical protein
VGCSTKPRSSFSASFCPLCFPCKLAQKESRRADSNRLPLLQLRVIGHVLQRFARACKSRISKRLSFLCLALRCTVLRSRWYQSGINITRKFA